MKITHSYICFGRQQTREGRMKKGSNLLGSRLAQIIRVKFQLFRRRPLRNPGARTTWRTQCKWNFSFSENLTTLKTRSFLCQLIRLKKKNTTQTDSHKDNYWLTKLKTAEIKLVSGPSFLPASEGCQQDLLSPSFHFDLLSSECWNHSEDRISPYAFKMALVFSSSQL